MTMARRPKGRKYRNLSRSADGIWRFQVTNPETRERTRVSLGTRDIDEAVEMKDEILSGTGNIVKPRRSAPTRFAEMAERYLDYGLEADGLANTTRHDRELLLRPKGRIGSFFGDYALDEIDLKLLQRYWREEVLEACNAEGKPTPRKPNTGKQDIAAISAVLRYARTTERLSDECDPCKKFRAELAGKRGKAAQAEKDPERDIRPVDLALLPALVVEARKESLRDLVYVLLLLDAGLRSGEALGLRWEHIAWGNEEERNSRKLWISENRPRGGASEAPKSGRSRTVGLSRRLRAALLEYQREKWGPSPDGHVLEGVDPDNWSKRELRRINKRVGITIRRKDLRDTFASVLLSSGIPIKYISKQLGHSKTATTEKYYAKWCHEDDYIDPVRLSPGELPADLLAANFDHHLTTKGLGGGDLESGVPAK